MTNKYQIDTALFPNAFPQVVSASALAASSAVAFTKDHSHLTNKSPSVELIVQRADPKYPCLFIYGPPDWTESKSVCLLKCRLLRSGLKHPAHFRISWGKAGAFPSIPGSLEYL